MATLSRKDSNSQAVGVGNKAAAVEVLCVSVWKCFSNSELCPLAGQLPAAGLVRAKGGA